ncbi:enolase [Patescibacteria group bacterium]|nr:enolase [Patescibacteria group bacterium]
MVKIKSIKPKEIKDSRGNPTVFVEIETNKGRFSASVPSGASTGKNEAVCLQTTIAIENIRKIIAPALKGREFAFIQELDEALIALDGTENKSKLGANAILPISISSCRAFAKEQKKPLYLHISDIFGTDPKLPLACFNVIEGGAHAKNNLDVQEFMIIPQRKKFRENFKIASDIYVALGKALNCPLGDEGGFAPSLDTAVQALYSLKGVITDDARIGLDVAASQFYSEGKYHIERKELSRGELLYYYKDLISKFPIDFIEDPFSEEDWSGFADARRELGVTIIGDDLLTTNVKRIKDAEQRSACNGVVIKPNQIGTITETIEAAKLARSFGWMLLVSHRSGETDDDFISDLAVGIAAEYIKSGSPVTKARMAKYNRLMEIEKEHG